MCHTQTHSRSSSDSGGLAGRLPATSLTRRFDSSHACVDDVIGAQEGESAVVMVRGTMYDVNLVTRVSKSGTAMSFGFLLMRV